MDRISVYTVAGERIVTWPCAAPPSAAILETMLKMLYPALEATPFSVSVKVDDKRYEPYSPCVCAGTYLITLHAPGDVTADMEIGVRARSSTPHGASTSRDLAADVVTDNLNSRYFHDGLQAALREWCFRRDQACVLTGVSDPAELDCAHILEPGYAAEWFAAGSRMDFCAMVPVVAGRSKEAMDVRNCVMITKSLHSAFDNFSFSISPEDDEFKVFVFNKHGSVKHGTKVITPRVDERFQEPTYYADLFPHKAVFLEHFCQAVLFNARAAADVLDWYDYDDSDMVDPTERDTNDSAASSAEKATMK
ncbi:hypothetical protein HDU85_005280 [Gaertneriomyces sp. JEL0708]|nr:hypothetical protein HDU85_005280 [Gaertneriomyces sp. JEL0708]